MVCVPLKTNLFSGSRRLLELADSIEEVKTTCAFCNRKAIFNIKFVNGVPVQEGPQVELGAEEKYLPACSCCYFEQVSEGRFARPLFNEQADFR